ncbi:dihydroorotate dehydrogenase electron transfer subunit [Zavarzinella formosa]|uniref:dihydroorotate dehydrogenase electron transfer subunit n=1 Tax=Zavarzinella formosa TaxID=360055 RepID=UPI000315C0AB|nr:dihydroorotate dehydrogenase electron transfer subunit [Zavarzinella formosa]
MILQRPAVTVENVQLAERTFRIRLEQPEIARSIRPGQFLMLRIPETTDPLLGRPFALYDTVLDSGGEPVGLDVVYLVVGKMTTHLMAVKAGEPIEVWGPLGNGFPKFPNIDQVTCVAGGIGQTPFLAYVRELLGTRGYAGQPAVRQVNKVSLYYGVRSAGFAAGVEDFRQAGCDVRLASDDGTVGTKGFVTQLLAADKPAGPFVGCGPEPMLKALAKLTASWNASCHVSLETPMACGFGACFSCVTPVCTPAGRDYKRVCVEGPVFDAATLAWD